MALVDYVGLAKLRLVFPAVQQNRGHPPAPATCQGRQALQEIDHPFVRLNVAAVQNAAAFRYQTW